MGVWLQLRGRGGAQSPRLALLKLSGVEAIVVQPADHAGHVMLPILGGSDV